MTSFTDTLRFVAANYLFAAANTADHFGAATRELFGALGHYVKPKRKRRTRPAAPSWLQEHRQVEEPTWPAN